MMDWNELLRDLLYAIITAAVPVITVFLSKFLKTHFDKVKVDIEESMMENTIKNTQELIDRVVLSVSQTYVDSLKSSGSFSKEAQVEAFNRAKDTVLSLLDEGSKTILESVYSDLNTWIEVQIESAVKRQKTSLNTTKEGE